MTERFFAVRAELVDATAPMRERRTIDGLAAAVRWLPSAPRSACRLAIPAIAFGRPAQAAASGAFARRSGSRHAIPVSGG